MAILKGTFIDITNEYTYYVQIGNTGEVINILDKRNGDDMQLFFSGESPVEIQSDMSDTFTNVYIRNASINLISNFDIRNYIVARNYTDIPVEIRYNNQYGDVIFSGFVIPLQFQQPYANVYTEFTVECVDKLGILEYIKFPPLLNHVYNYNTPRYFINLCLDKCSFADKRYIGGNNNHIKYDHTDDTQINPTLFIGASEDNWYNCLDVLKEIGKAYGCYFYQNGNVCYIENILLYDLSEPHLVAKNEYRSDDTNISIQEAYNRIKYTIDISNVDEALVDPFNDSNLEATTNLPERFLTELIDNNYQNTPSVLRNLCNVAKDQTENVVNWSNYFRDNRDSYVDQLEKIGVYDNYCQILKNKMFDFGENNYLTSGYGKNTTNAWRTLHWLWEHPGKGAFISFGKTNNLANAINAETIKIEDMKNVLLIQVNGSRQYVDGPTYNSNIPSMFTNQFNSSKPVCTLFLNQSNNLVPSDRGIKNYIVISGNITLNPLLPRTGPNAYGVEFPGVITPTTRPREVWFDSNPANQYVRANNNSLQSAVDWWDQNWEYKSTMRNYTLIDRYIIDYTQMKETDDPQYGGAMAQDGNYYQYYSWTNSQNYDNWPYNQSPVFTGPQLALPCLTPEYKRFKYSTSTYDKSGQNEPVDTVSQISILACELKIGNKYLIENMDLLEQTNWNVPDELLDQLYSWKTYDQCPIKNGVKQTWFTLSIHVNPGDPIIGKEYSIRNSVTISTGIEAEGLCIPISYSDALLGQFSFKILGPYNTAVDNINERNLGITELINSHKTIFDWSPFNYKTGTNYNPLMAYVENIIISNLKFSLYKGGSAYSKNNNNDLVYYSWTDEEYINEQETDCQICTSLRNTEIPSGVDYSPNNSSIMNLNDEPWYGMTEYNGTTVSEGNEIKLEEARVTEQYNIWNRPRKIIETTLRLRDPEKSYYDTNFKFDYLKYNENNYQIYKTISRDINLKNNTMHCTMKELSENPA